MFTLAKLEAKHSALGALCNLASLQENIPCLINSGFVAHLLQLMFSVTSVLMTLREPASVILASITQSELILKYKDITLRMFSLLNLSSPVIQLHLLLALNRIASHSNAKRCKAEMKEKGAVQLLLPFLIESNAESRVIALNLLFNLSHEFGAELTELLGETHLNILVDIIATSTIVKEKAAAVGVFINISAKDKMATGILANANLLPVLRSLLEASLTGFSRVFAPEHCRCIGLAYGSLRYKTAESIGCTWSNPCLVKLLSEGSSAARSRAATLFAQLSQNSHNQKPKSSIWSCGPSSSQPFCEVHNC